MYSLSQTVCVIFLWCIWKCNSCYLQCLGQKLIKKHLELEHQARWAACAGCQQSKMLMRYPLPGRANELLAMSRLRLRAVNRPHTSKSSFVETWTHRVARMLTVWIWQRRHCTHHMSLSCTGLWKMGWHVFKVWRSWESEGRQPIKPST
jgi:hypothetical protein